MSTLISQFKAEFEQASDSHINDKFVFVNQQFQQSINGLENMFFFFLSTIAKLNPDQYNHTTIKYTMNNIDYAGDPNGKTNI